MIASVDVFSSSVIPRSMLVGINLSSLQFTSISAYLYLNHLSHCRETKFSKLFVKRKEQFSELQAYKSAVNVLWLPSAVIKLDACLTKENFAIITAKKKGEYCCNKFVMQ